jgi:hypothetical protein
MSSQEGPLSQPDPLSLTVPGGTAATRDRDVIRRWAELRHAEPSTGEGTTSGPATIDVNDGGVGVRFNFPGAARFRPITWDEWFANFDRYRLVFVYEEPLTDANNARYSIEEIDRLTARFPQLEL